MPCCRLGWLSLLWLGLLLQPVNALGAATEDRALAERLNYLRAQVEELREGEFLRVQQVELLKQRLLEKFPVGEQETPSGRERLKLLLKAAIRTRALAGRDYSEPRPGAAGYIQPEDVVRSGKAYNIDLFNALLGKKRLEAASDPDGKTALMYAAEADQFEVLRTIVPLEQKVGRYEWLRRKLGRSPRLPFEPLYDEGGEPKRPYIDWCDKDGYTALMHASSNRAIGAVNYLLNAGASLEARCSVAQFDALQLAQIAGDATVASAIERKLNDRPWPMQLVGSSDFGSTLVWGFLMGGASVSTLLLAVRQIVRHLSERRRKKELLGVREQLDSESEEGELSVSGRKRKTV